MGVECHFRDGSQSEELVEYINGKASELKKRAQFKRVRCTFDHEKGEGSCLVEVYFDDDKVSFKSHILGDDYHKIFDKAWKKMAHQVNSWQGKEPKKSHVPCMRINKIWKAG